jgi:hypothetical protein
MKTITITPASIIKNNDMFELEDVDMSVVKNHVEKYVNNLKKVNATDISIAYDEKELTATINYNRI